MSQMGMKPQFLNCWFLLFQNVTEYIHLAKTAATGVMIIIKVIQSPNSKSGVQ